MEYNKIDITFGDYITYSPYMVRESKSSGMTRNSFLEVFNSLPKPRQEWLKSYETAQKIKGICFKYRLSLEDSLDIVRYSRDILSGIKSPQALKELAGEVYVEEGVAPSLLEELVNNILIQRLDPENTQTDTPSVPGQTINLRERK